MSAEHTCPDCGAELPPDAAQGLCPRCVLKAGLDNDSGETVVLSEAELRTGQSAVPEKLFGGYRIVRTLGQGGMGAVYEAEHLESGRRVALKVLSRKLDSPEARKRFLREGRLAASINHPNSVYVYGTEEIDGTPVIAMELVPGGTLQERVQSRGPLPVAEAVDDILQIISGLEAAQSIGILHRDVKPANCFVDTDGAVKIGDFGLSISTAARGETEVTVQGSFLGTPAFSSPEQLRGDELNVRSDIYAVGVTLFYLLTGRTPFQAGNMVKLLATVLEQPAPSPAQFRPGIPKGLCEVALRCLAKAPSERFRNYEELRQALLPYSSVAPVPASPGLRFVAGIVDLVLLSWVMGVLQWIVLGDVTHYLNPLSFTSPKFMAFAIGGCAALVMYYAVLEGCWGASLGKRLCGLRVVREDRNAPGFGRAFARAWLFVVPPALPFWIVAGLGQAGNLLAAGGWERWLILYSYYLILGILFSTMRRRNGFAGIHDLATGTRVVRKVVQPSRPVLELTEEEGPVSEDAARVGPYHVLGMLSDAGDEQWLLGYDTKLLRKVWLHLVPPGTPPVPQHLRRLTRAGRLRWLSGKRSAEENWDAFEGVAGRALSQMTGERRRWAEVRFWLLDIVDELRAAASDGTLPAALATDRVWITAAGRAKLLDFPAPGTAGAPAQFAPPPAISNPADAHRIGAAFLHEVAATALHGAGRLAAPLALHAQRFLEALTRFPSLDEITSTLQPLLHKRAAVSRAQRAFIVAGCAAFPLLAVAGMIAGSFLIKKWEAQNPQIMQMNTLLQHRTFGRLPWLKSGNRRHDRLLAILVAGRYRDTITNAAAWDSLFARTIISGESRRFAERAVAEHPHPPAEEVAEAEANFKPLLQASRAGGVFGQPGFVPLVAIVSLVVYVAVPAMIAALVFRGGLVLLICGAAVVREDGSRASRRRAFLRSIIVWLPVLVILPLAAIFGRSQSGIGLWALALGGAYLAIVIWSTLLPERGWPDRIARTWLVPR